jgi:prepilin-type N-terminal cleavage/methylation domain-containing protein
MTRRGAFTMPGRAGFTAVELLVVVGVLAVLLTLLFPAYSAIRRSQKIKRTEATVEVLAAAAESYANDYGIYPPAAYGTEQANWGNRSLVVLLNARGGRGAPYLPSAFYDRGEVKGPLFLDAWARPFIYFDTSAMHGKTEHDYTVRGNPTVTPIEGPDGYYNFGGCQVWSCGPNERNDGGRNLHREGADDLANFAIKD